MVCEDGGGGKDYNVVTDETKPNPDSSEKPQHIGQLHSIKSLFRIWARGDSFRAPPISMAHYDHQSSNIKG